ncbi:uncharacterized protein LOC123680011 isoform X2 [Harmonia axyridis]|uniref:uncharacterized protein LOC123680011 isoform X2 n=1 Tax=Harmonia axyridis TaxID=115357 RepID=UPI001E2772DD|nr:uncharacterized protein LOC123680011 isoform X2 [Harmonia axyridis]
MIFNEGLQPSIHELSLLVFTIFLVINAVFAAETVVKRGLFEPEFIGGNFNSFENHGYNGIPAFPVLPPPTVSFGKSYLPKPSVSPGEIASAIQAAKEASDLVMESQRRVQDAKESVLHQQHVASQKQAQAALALQRAEAAAAVQQQEAKAAANGLVLAQQRLAQAKSEVSEHQKLAAIREAQAAAIIQKSANLAAANIQKSDDAAKKLNAIQYSGNEALRQSAAGKDGSLSATSAAVAATGNAGKHEGFAFISSPKLFALQPWR